MVSKDGKKLVKGTKTSSQSDNVPFQRISNRLQQKADRKAQKNAEGDIIERASARERSRSLSITSTQRKKTEMAVLTGIDEKKEAVITEEVEELPTFSRKSPSRKKQSRSRSTTPTRILPSQIARDNSVVLQSPVRLTRSARKLGFCTPDQEKVTKLEIAASPKESHKSEEDIVSSHSPSTSQQEPENNCQQVFDEFMQNWKSSDSSREIDNEEPMEISEILLTEADFSSSTDKCEAEEQVKEHVNSEKIDSLESPTDTIIVEEVQLCVNRTLDMVYFDKAQDKENKDKTDPEERVRSSQIKQKESLDKIDDETRKKEKTSNKTRSMITSNDANAQTTNGVEEHINFPTISLEKMVYNSKECSNEMTSLLQNLYSWVNSLQRRIDDLPDKFINNNTEIIWQYNAHKNKQINKDWKKYQAFLDAPLAVIGYNDDDDERSDEEEGEQSFDDEEDANSDELEVNDEDEDECDLFNLNDEDLKDMERELEQDTSAANAVIKNKNETVTKKYPRSKVDDKFFNLAEMDAFCDEAEKRNDEDNLLDTVDDSWGDPADYHYEDFFGKLDDVIDNNSGYQLKKRKLETSLENAIKKKKTVRFAIEEGDEHSDNYKKQVEHKNQEFELNPESKLKTDIRKLQESIRKLEEENLEPRSWELSGEVSGQQRNENELLETHLQFDSAAKRAPEVNEDFTEKLEAIIKQRIKDQAFDDVVRIKKADEKSDTYRNKAIEEQEITKKSLAEVYEKEYQNAAGQTEVSSSENPIHKNIQSKMDKLFNLIDAMCHFEYAPPTVKPEIKVLTNMAALQVEEVGMQASTDSQLLAPEEIRKRQKGELKASEEKTKTDKLRQRRKKKTKQRTMVQKFGEDKALGNQIEKKMKKRKADKPVEKESMVKSSSFFSKLQDTVQKEIQQKTTKKIKSQMVTTSSKKFKL